MAIIDPNIDREIAAAQKAVEALQKKKDQQEKKLKGVEAFIDAINNISEEYDVSEAELLSAKGDKFVSVLKSAKKLDPAPKYVARIAELFEASGTADKKAGKVKKVAKKRKKTVSNEPKLPVGSYVNPHTGEVINKVKRAPKPLKEWCINYGEDTVLSWKK